MSIQDQINKNWLLLGLIVLALVIVLYFAVGGIASLFGGTATSALAAYLQRKHQADLDEQKIIAKHKERTGKEINRHNKKLDKIRSDLDRDLARVKKQSKEASPEELRKSLLEDLDV